MLRHQAGNKKGILIIEILVVIAICAIALVSLLSLATFSLQASSLIKNTSQAREIAQETMEAVRNFRDGTIWTTTGLGVLTIGTAYHPEKTADTPPKWTLVSGEGPVDIFSQKVVFERVYRDSNDDIAASGTEDQNTRKTTVTVFWQERGRSHKIELITYLTNWK